MKLINRNNAVLKAHGVIEVHDRYERIIRDAEPVVVGGVASWLPIDYANHLNVISLDDLRLEIRDGLPYTGKRDMHDFNALKLAQLFAPEKIGLHVTLTGMSLFGLMDGFGPPLRSPDKVAAVFLSYMSSSRSHWPTYVQAADRNGTMFIAHTASANAYPGVENLYGDAPGLMVAIPVNEVSGKSRGFYNPETKGCVGVIATAESWATPMLASAVALMRILRPNLSNEEIRYILVKTSKLVGSSNGPGILDMKAAADFVMQTKGQETVEEEEMPEVEENEVPVIDEEVVPAVPAVPVIEDKEMIGEETQRGFDITENELLSIRVLSDAVNGPNQSRGNKTEGIDLALVGAGKTLFWDKSATFEVTPKVDLHFLGFVTANDAPRRNVSVVLIDGVEYGFTEITAEAPPFSFIELASSQGVFIEAGRRYIFEIRNSGDWFTQFSEMRFKVHVPEPEPEPDPDPKPKEIYVRFRIISGNWEIHTISLIPSDGHERFVLATLLE